MINKNFKRDDYRSDRTYDRMPAFQLNKFQSEFNLSFNKEMAKVIASALQRNEELVQNSGKNVPTCLYALLSKLEDVQKPRSYDERGYQDGDDYENDNRHHDEQSDSYEYHN